MLTCRGCKIEFTPKRKDQKYHTRGCFLESTVRFIACPHCGNKFQRKFTKQICCSSKCANAYRAKKQIKGVTIICNLSGCNKKRHIMPSRKRKFNFCSREHQILYLKSKQNKGMSKNWYHSLEARAKITQSNLDRDYDKTFTAETRKKLAEGAKRKIWTPEAREKLRNANLGKTLSEETKQKIKAHAKYGQYNSQYKGDKASNSAKHMRAAVKRNDELKICAKFATDSQHCKGRLENSNKDHLHSDIPTDWKWLCKNHHNMYMWQYGLVNPTGMALRFYSKFGNSHMRSLTLDGIIIDEKEVTTNYL